MNQPSISPRDKELEASVSEKGLEVPVYNAHIDVSGIDERKLIWKIDLRLIPWLSFLYLLSFLDRTSIGNARVCFHFNFCCKKTYN
jgi:hypothetical protein